MTTTNTHIGQVNCPESLYKLLMDEEVCQSKLTLQTNDQQIYAAVQNTLLFFSKPVIFSGAVYTVTKILQSVLKSRTDISEMLESKLGQHHWAFLNDVVLDNAWISVFVISLILSESTKPIAIEQLLQLTVMGLGTSTLGWIFRKAVAAHLPTLAMRIAAFVAPAGRQ